VSAFEQFTLTPVFEADVPSDDRGSIAPAEETFYIVFASILLVLSGGYTLVRMKKVSRVAYTCRKNNYALAFRKDAVAANSRNLR